MQDLKEAIRIVERCKITVPEYEVEAITTLQDLAQLFLEAKWFPTEYDIAKVMEGRSLTGGAKKEECAKDIHDLCTLAHVKAMDEKNNQLINATRLLEICKGAINDAIYCEDGLDGSTGESIVEDIEKLLKENPATCQECDHLIAENLKLGEQLKAQQHKASLKEGE